MLSVDQFYLRHPIVVSWSSYWGFLAYILLQIKTELILTKDLMVWMRWDYHTCIHTPDKCSFGLDGFEDDKGGMIMNMGMIIFVIIILANMVMMMISIMMTVMMMVTTCVVSHCSSYLVSHFSSYSTFFGKSNQHPPKKDVCWPNSLGQKKNLGFGLRSSQGSFV